MYCGIYHNVEVKCKMSTKEGKKNGNTVLEVSYFIYEVIHYLKEIKLYVANSKIQLKEKRNRQEVNRKD